MSVNQFILNMRDNLVPIRKDATGIAHYDGKRDTIYIPAQKNFPTYGDYVQEVARQVAHATGITGRLNRDRGTMQKKAIVEELASAVKMLDFGMTAKLRPETMKDLPAIIERMKENPQYAKEVMRDVNRTVGMIKKAESGEKKSGSNITETTTNRQEVPHNDHYKSNADSGFVERQIKKESGATGDKSSKKNAYSKVRSVNSYGNVLYNAYGIVSNSVADIANSEEGASSQFVSGIPSYDYTKIPIFIFALFLIALAAIVGYDKVKT